MIVLKFGGTSVGTPQRMQEVADIITSDDQPKMVVLSAVSGTTNALVSYADRLMRGQKEEALAGLLALEDHYHQFIAELFPENPWRGQALEFVEERFAQLRNFADKISRKTEKAILAQGEIVSTHLFTWLLESQGVEACLLPALNFMRVDKSAEPDEFYIRSMLDKELQLKGTCRLYITQGYICRNAYGEVDNLKRGGSDYTATLIGQALEADAIQIWTDIDGMHNNDPRVVDNTFPIQHLSYGEAAELAYFGAKILHPTCVLPAQKAGIPIHLKNTMDPAASGTIISAKESHTDMTAVAAKDGITAIKIKSGRMLMAYGFLKRVFEVFEQYRTPIDMITTSEVAVSLTIDDTAQLSHILDDLREFGEVEIDREQTIICIVGDFNSDRSGYATRIFSALSDIPVRMISYGGSKYNVSVLIHARYKQKALEALNHGLFGL